MSRPPNVPIQLTSGPFTFDDAQRAGLTRRQLQGSSWENIGPSLYRWAGLPPTPLLALTTLSLRHPTAVFSGLTAAWLHGLDVPPCDPIEITLPPGTTSQRAGALVHRELLAPDDIVRRRDLPTASALKTVTDQARRQTVVEGVVVADMALHNQLVTLAEMARFADQSKGAKGIARLRKVLDLVEPATESPMETRLRVLLVMNGLPRPEAQAPLYDQDGQFLGRPDLLYREAKLALEYDGGTHRDSLAEDNRRQNRLQNAGYWLLRFTASDIYNHSQSVVMQVRAALRRDRAAHPSHRRRTTSL